MSAARPTTVLCLSSYLKGHEFLRECRRLGCRVLLITVEKLREADWPRDSIDEVFYMPDLFRREDVIHGVSYLARTEHIDRIVPLDEFDLEMASTLREHLRVPGMGETTVRYFRDKLAMRMRAQEVGIPVPEFVPILNYDRIHEYLEAVPPPWILKPRLSASAIGIRKLDDPEEVWSTVEELGDKRSFHLLERFVRGDVFHVDSLAWEREIVFSEAHGYLNPPFEVYHGGGLFCTRTLPRDSEVSRALRELDREVIRALGMVRGALHTEFIRGDEDGRYYFLETAARVGGANIADLVEAATGVNLWREWARLEVASARGEAYRPPEARDDSAGLLISLARQEWPDTGAYDDPEIVWRLDKRHHAGLLVRSLRQERVEELLRSYMARFRDDFYASMPAATEATE
ncbi:MAG TPA: ATP-grasp domain-containing protein [Longimicrobiaceae bacterium]|nr:ATP-grasp domain-containing protein [Longimicrobiaceae bacterium]